MQKDGDLWKLAWEAIFKKRCSKSKTEKKVKGHATEKDIEEGKNTEDREGNDRSDSNADKGVLMIGGEGLVDLGNWLADRHDAYIQVYEEGTEDDCRNHESREGGESKEKQSKEGTARLRPCDMDTDRR